MTYDKNNIFAKRLRGEIPNETIYENEYVSVFNDLHPQSDIHIVVIPKGEYIDFFDFNTNASIEEKNAFFDAITKIAKDKNIDTGCQLLANCGKNGGQVIPHFHMHIISKETLKFK